jgi:hypothetical protein
MGPTPSNAQFATRTTIWPVRTCRQAHRVGACPLCPLRCSGGVTDIQLCQLLKDPSRNGNRTVAQVVLHMRTPLVAWGFHPGEGRTPVPMTYQAFLQKVNNWIVKGANCPQVR